MSSGTNDLLRRQNREARDRAKIKARLVTLLRTARRTREVLWDIMDSSQTSVLDEAIAKLEWLAK